jgi:hypothetical protein
MDTEPTLEHQIHELRRLDALRAEARALRKRD